MFMHSQLVHFVANGTINAAQLVHGIRKLTGEEFPSIAFFRLPDARPYIPRTLGGLFTELEQLINASLASSVEALYTFACTAELFRIFRCGHG